MICSDGLTDGLWDHRIEDILRSATPGHNMSQALVEEAVAESGRDNTTAVVIEVNPSV